MAYYVFVDVNIADPEGYLDYMRLIKPGIEAAGGTFLARGGHFRVCEGEFQPHRIILMEFPTQRHWDEFYDSPAYAPLRRMRTDSAETTMIAFAGL